MRRATRILSLVIAALIGAILGRLMAHHTGASFSEPEPLNTAQWQVISPGLEAGLLHPGRGSHRASDALVITDHLFFRADRLVPILGGVPAAVDLQLAEDSGTLEILLGQPPGGMTRVHPDSHGTDISLSLQDGVLLLGTSAGPQALGSSAPERLEFSAAGGSARLASIQVRDARGDVLLSQDYRGAGVSPDLLQHGTALGAVCGVLMCVVVAGRRLTHGLALGATVSLAPVLVLMTPSDAWLRWLERLYLVDSSPSQLACAVLLVCLIPLLVVAGGAILQPVWSASVRPLPALRWVWLAGLLIVSAAGWTASWWMLAAVIWAVVPTWLLRADARALETWLALDLVALIMIGSMGWGLGLGLATLWRVAVLLAGAGLLADRIPGPAMSALFLMTISVIPAAESALRATSLDKTWDPTQLSEERPSERGWQDPVESWSGRCGSGEASRSLLVAGGSSVGGAYQYKDDPEASFVAQAHLSLCASMGGKGQLKTHNYGRGNRDTFTISRTIEAMLDKTQADVVVLYVGVNDLLADHHPLSRKERESQRAARSAALQGVAGLARRLRMVTALWLATRSLPDADAPSVPDVPLADAIENFQTIADAAHARGAQVVLMTEHMRAEQSARLNAYRHAQQTLADGQAGVQFLDARPAFEGATDDEILVDQNHLTRQGGQRLGHMLAEALAPLLWSQGSSR